MGKEENAGNHNVFYHIKNINHNFSNIRFVVCKCFQFGQGQNFVVWQRVNSSSKDDNLDMVKVEALTDNRSEVVQVTSLVLYRYKKKHCWNRRKHRLSLSHNVSESPRTQEGKNGIVW